MSPLLLIFPSSATAAGKLNLALIRLDRMKALTQTSLMVWFNPNSAGAVAKVKITFPAGFTLSSSPTVDTVNLDPGVAIPPGGLSASTSGQTITVSGLSGVSSGITYGFNVNGVTNPNVGSYQATVATADSTGSVIESTNVGLFIVANDQVGVGINQPASGCSRADFNADHHINIFDLSILLSHYGSTSTQGDVNHDGHVNIFDLSILLSCYGT